MRILILLLLFVALPLHAAGDRLLFYKAVHEKTELYLLGSMHLARQDIYPLRPQIMQAFDASDTLVVEVDITDDAGAEIQQLMLTHGMYPPGESIRNHISKETWTRLEKLIRQYALPVEVFAQFRPGFLATTLSTMEMMRLGMQPELGIDNFFLQSASGDKDIQELETAIEQVMLLQNFPDTEIVILETLDSIDDLDLFMDQMIAAWKLGDADGLKKIVLDEPIEEFPEYAEFYEKIFDERNEKMTEKLDGFLRTRGSYFVVVGAGHLLGREGIVELLRKRGFEVQQL